MPILSIGPNTFEIYCIHITAFPALIEKIVNSGFVAMRINMPIVSALMIKMIGEYIASVIRKITPSTRVTESHSLNFEDDEEQSV